MIQESFVDDSGLALLHTTIHRPSIVAAFQDNDLVEISEDCGRFVATKPVIELCTHIQSNDLQRRGRPIPAILSTSPHSILSH